MDTKLIDSISRQIAQASYKISELAQEIPVSDDEVNNLYTNMMMDELEHIQILTLKLTELISAEVGEEKTGSDE